MLQNPLFWLVFLSFAVGMEFWAMLLHGRLWHGPWWPTHRSHHRPRQGVLEFNDIFAVVHASIAIVLIIGGCERWYGAQSPLFVAAGLGMTLFGISYFIVHDGLIHGRLPVAFLGRIAFLRQVRNAHLVHHKNEAEPYGLFLGQHELRHSLARTGKVRRGHRA